jgi:hypothetical protein
MEVLENRLNSMQQLRIQMEHLADVQKREESNYLETIKEFLKQRYVPLNDDPVFEYSQSTSSDKKGSTETQLKIRLDEVEKRYRLEQKERVKAQKMFTTFRAEGSSIIHRLRDSLTRITQKYKSVSSKVNELEEQLEEEQHKSEQLGQLYDEAIETLNKNGQIIKNYSPKRSGTTAATTIASTANTSTQDNEQIQQYESKIAHLKKALARVKREVRKMKGDDTSKQQQQVSNSDGEVSDEEDTHWDSVEMNRLKAKIRAEKELRIKTERIVEEKFLQFQNLVEEEEQVIDTLKIKLKEAENENDKLKYQLKRALVAKEAAYSNSESSEIPAEYVDLYTELKNLLDPEDNRNLQSDKHSTSSNPINPYDKVKAQERLIKLLLAKLKAEEEERLRHEEIVAEEEKSILFLEQKIKDLENIVTMQKEEAANERLKLRRLVSSDKLKQIDSLAEDDRMLLLEQELKHITEELNEEIAISKSQLLSKMIPDIEFTL